MPINYVYPIKYFEENLYFKRDKSCWAVYKMESFGYDFRSRSEKFSIHSSLTRLLWNIGLEGHIRIIPIMSSLTEDNEELKRTAKGPLKMTAIKEIDDETEDLTNYLGDEGNDYEFFIFVKLEKPKNFFASLAEFGKSLYQDPIRVINEYAGIESPEIYLREVEAYKNFEDIVFNRISKSIKVSRTDEYTTQMIIKHPFYFGIGNPPMRGYKAVKTRTRMDDSKVWKPKGDIILRNNEKYLRAHERDILTLTEGEINKKPLRHLEVTQFHNGKDTTSLQAHIVISEMPDIPFPGGEWLYDLLADIKFSMSISIRFRVLEYKASMNEVKKKQKDLADQNDHISQSSNAVPLDLLESSEEAYTMEYDLKRNKFPLLYTSIIIAVSARNKETLQKKIEDIRGHLGDIRSEVPAGDQWKLFNEMMIGGDQFASDYILKLSPEHLAGAMIGATKKLGDNSGFYLGITGQLKKPVRIDTRRPSRENRAPNITSSGSQGGGKSYLSDLITCKSVKYMGAKAVIIDPKGDRTYWEHDLKSFEGQVKVTTFTADENDKGKLDPFNIMKTDLTSDNYQDKMKEAAALALDICMFLIAADRKDQRTRLLLDAVTRVVNKPNPAMNKIIAELKVMEKEAEEENDIIKKNMCNDISSTLNSYRKMAYATLLFGDGDEEAVNLEKSINVLQIQNLVFPKEGTPVDSYTFQEIIGYACLLAISGYIMTFIMGDRSILRIFELDEVTVFNSTPVGKNLINKLRRMARALNTPGIFISQSVDDIGDDKEKDNIGYKFAFKSTNDKEVKKILNYFGLEETEENINVINNLENGICLFQDLEGRTGILAVDSVFEEYNWAFDTKPDTMAQKKKMYLGG